jgi:hypothetical protein
VFWLVNLILKYLHINKIKRNASNHATNHAKNHTSKNKSKNAPKNEAEFLLGLS